MYKTMRTVVGGTFVTLLAGALISALAPVGSARPEAAETAAEATPPADQTYVGSKRCASCHFEEFMKWKKDKHSTSFDLLPKQYQKDPKCLKCHTTGYGEPSGFKDFESSASLAGTTCETCHGPGSKHEEVCKPLAKIKQLNPAQQKQAKDSIWMMIPKNVCIECHLTKAHKESATPKELRKTKP